jgi:HNH endonuclease
LCIYCAQNKPRSDFSDEHIWPQALGGDPLSSFWRTNDVCAQCNSMSGVFVDGAFIRGWAGSAERTHDTNQYLSLDDPTKSAPPPNYLGQLNHRAIRPDEVVDWWVGPCGATILHFRPKETEALWSSYVGGDPRPNRTKPGRAYIALASENEYWLVSALVSFKNQFKRDARFLVNLTAPPEWSAFQNVDRKHAEQAADLLVFGSITDAAKAGESVPARQEIRNDTGHRLLCKLGLAIGCQLFGPEFTLHPDGDNLRRAFREADLQRRQQIPIRGAGYFTGGRDAPLGMLAWPGAWVLLVQIIKGTLALVAISPSKMPMAISITSETSLVSQLPPEYAEGQVWIAVPTLLKAVGPISLPQYASHLAGALLHPDLIELDAARIDPAMLPPC